MADGEMDIPEFGQHGFLSTNIHQVIADVTAANSEWFSLLHDANHILQTMVTAGSKQHHGATLDPASLATFSGLRSLGNLQAAIMTLERGMVTEARVMVRCLFENSFCIAALAEAPAAFIPMLEDDNRAAKRGQAKVLKEGAYVLSDDVRTSIEALSDARGGGNLNWKKIADMTSIKQTYLLYRFLCDDSAHYSVSSLKRHLVADSSSRTWSGYRFGPGTKKEVSLTAFLCASAALSIVVGYAQICADGGLGQEINAMLDRYTDLRPDMQGDDLALADV